MLVNFRTMRRSFGIAWLALLVIGQPFAAAFAEQQPAVAPTAENKPGTIAVAASLRTAIEALIAKFNEGGGGKITASFGATGNLVRQVETGAPFELFLAADEKSVDKLAAGGFTEGAGEVLVIGRLVVAAPTASPVAVDPELAGLKKALEAGQVTRIAIANPELAPYGRAAEEALGKAKLLDAAKPKFVLGESVAQATQYAATGSVEAAFIPQSLAVSPEIAPKLKVALIPAEAHKPIRQKAAILKNAGPVARAFYAFLKTPAASATFERYGFSVPK